MLVWLFELIIGFAILAIIIGMWANLFKGVKD